MSERNPNTGPGELRDEPCRNLLGASVTIVTPARLAVRRSPSCAVGRRNIAGLCTPGFSGDRKGPSRWMPRTLGLPGTSCCTALSAARVFAGVSLIRVGSRVVVPNLQCARTMAAIPSGVGSSLNSTSPPPFTWISTKPGASQVPSGRACIGTAEGKSDRGRRAAMWHPSIKTAQSCCRREPSKTVPAITAYRSESFIGCG